MSAAALRAGLALAVLAVPATALVAADPRTLEASGGQGGRIGAKSERAADNAPFECFAIEVPAGSEFKVSMTSDDFTPEVWIARGAQCSSAAIQAQSEEPAKASNLAEVTFESAGGRYLVFARSRNPAAKGTYRIKVLTAIAGTSDDAAEASNASEPGSAEDERMALMNQQVDVREKQLAAEAAQKAAAEKERRLALARAEEARRQAEASSGGDSGMLGGLMFGLGAALAGGNAEVVMGAAMKGVEMTTDNEMVRNVVAGQGDAMIASGLGGSSGSVAGSTSSAGAALAARPSAIGGNSACAGMNESNYRDVALSGGGDVQLKTMCAQSYQLYNDYKNAVAQGYSEADIQRAYAAHQQSAMVVQNFYEEAGSSGGGIHQDTHGPQAPAPIQAPDRAQAPSAPCNATGGASCVSPQ